MKILWFLTFFLVSALAGTAAAFCPTGSALEFDGVDDYTNTVILNLDTITISTWINISGGIERQDIISNHNDGGYGLFYREEGDLRWSVHINGAYRGVNSDTSIEKKRWYHVAATYNGDSGHLYIDGVEQTGSFDDDGLITDSNVPLTIGGNPLIGGGITTPFNGTVDEVVIYDRALSAEEIGQIYHCGVYSDSNIVGYWDFDEGIGQTVHDSSGNGNDGYLGNNPADFDIQDPNWVLSDILPEPDYYVDVKGPGDPEPNNPLISDPCEDGSIDHPFDAIQEAIDKAYEDCNGLCSDCNSICCPVILVRDGWYDGPGNYDIDPCGIQCVLKSENGPWETIIDPCGRGRVFFIDSNETACTVIDGFLIFDGYASEIHFPDTTRQLGGAIYCQGGGPTIRNCVMIGNYAYHSGGGIYLNESDATIYRCEFLLNDSRIAGGGIYAHKSNPLIQNCVIAGNFSSWSGGISSNVDSNSTIINCTISDNYADHGPDGLECVWNGHANVKNTIFWTDTRWWQWLYNQQPESNSLPQKHIFLESESSLSISYSDIEGGWEGVHVEDANCTLDWGLGNLNADPLFTRYFFFDYHLQSGYGRWSPIAESNGDYNNDDWIDFKDFAIFARYWQQPHAPQYVDLDNDGFVDVNDLGIFCSRWLSPGDNTAGWVKDDVNSPCLDAGDPCSPYFLEPNPNGARVNMGAYGNTDQASLTTEIAAERRHPDLDKDKDVDFYDFALFAEYWLVTGDDIAADFDYSKLVNYVDLIEFSRWWLWGKP